MYARVHLGYDRGCPRPGVHSAPPLYGKLLSERVRGVIVVHLWPHDFPLNARAEDGVQPLASLWRPAFSVATENEVGLSGLERQQVAGEARWVAQRWMCEPMTLAGITEAIRRSHG